MRDFKLSPTFLADYEGTQPGFGPLGYVTYKRTYSRKLEDGSTEEFWQTCQRVVEGVYSAQKRHVKNLGLPWNNEKAQRSAQEMFRRMWEFKWLPPGRGLWMMGTPYIERAGGAALNNCGFVSTRGIKDDLADPFCWMMDMLMLGVGVGFDTKGEGIVTVQAPRQGTHTFQVADSREGWVDLLRATILPYSGKGYVPAEIDYSLVRPEGSAIAGFGGTASGPKPLQELVSSVKEILDALVGQEITTEAIVDVANLIGRCVVAGNVRRSAEIAFGDPHNETFLDLKDWDKNREAVEHHRWASNNSVFADVGMDYSLVAQRTATNGEPGYEWLENAQDYSRMGRDPDYKDRRVAGANPCVTGDTWVHTANGPQQVISLVGRTFIAIVDGKPHFSGSRGFWYTGDKEVWQLSTDAGYRLQATENHKILTRENGKDVWVELGDIRPGETKVVLSNHREVPGWGDATEYSFAEGYLAGHLTGAGTLIGSKAVFSVWEKDGAGIKGMMEEVSKSINNLGLIHRPDRLRWTEVKGRGEFRLNSTPVASRLLSSLRMEPGDKVPNLFDLERKDAMFTRGFLRGIFDTDGSVQGSQDKGVSVRLAQAHLGLLRVLQRSLLRLGINSRLYENRQPERLAELPNGKGGTALYQCRAVHELIISKDNLHQFDKLVGFSHADKAAALADALASYKRTPNAETFVTTVTGISYVGELPVYDAEVRDVHRFEANGIVVHNCVEQSLEDRELCCLVETFPSRHDTYDDYRKTLKYAYLYAKSVTLIHTHDQRTNAVMMRNRRIGCSMSGIVQAMARHGRREFFSWCDQGYNYLEDLDVVYSEWLCIPLSVKKTSVKPSGTVSLLPGVTPGIHYPHSEYYIRRIRFQETHPLVDALRTKGYHIEKDVYSPNTVVAEFPVHEEYFDRSKSDVTMWEQLENAAQMQTYWADNQVSVTVTFDKDREGHDIKYALELYETRLKGVSFLPVSDHGFAQAPYEEIDEKKYKDMIANVNENVQLADLISGNGEVQDSLDRFCDGEVCKI
jgi:ribonucleotide reductase class II